MFVYMVCVQVVVTNQITGIVSHDDDESDCSELDNDFTITAALGNTWSHCVNTRLLMTPASESDKCIVSINNSRILKVLHYITAYNCKVTNSPFSPNGLPY